jgi:hypothetical protein
MADGKNTSLPLTLLTSKRTVEHPSLPAGDPMLAAFEGEIGEVAASVKQGKRSQLLGGDLARDAIVLCHKQTESVRKGKTIVV